MSVSKNSFIAKLKMCFSQYYHIDSHDIKVMEIESDCITIPICDNPLSLWWNDDDGYPRFKQERLDLRGKMFDHESGRLFHFGYSPKTRILAVNFV